MSDLDGWLWPYLYDVLFRVAYYAGESDGMTAYDVRSYLPYPPPSHQNVTGRLRSLERMGLVARRRIPRDPALYWSVTEPGMLTVGGMDPP